MLRCKAVAGWLLLLMRDPSLVVVSHKRVPFRLFRWQPEKNITNLHTFARCDGFFFFFSARKIKRKMIKLGCTEDNWWNFIKEFISIFFSGSYAASGDNLLRPPNANLSYRYLQSRGLLILQSFANSRFKRGYTALLGLFELCNCTFRYLLGLFTLQAIPMDLKEPSKAKIKSMKCSCNQIQSHPFGIKENFSSELN